MKLYKALKLRKKLIGEITQLKAKIQRNNSYMEGSLNPEKHNVPKMYEELLNKIEELIDVKYVINEANREIQTRIYRLAEYKALIVFLNSMSTIEGMQESGGYGSSALREYKAQIDEETRNKYVAEFQNRVDSIQEEIDTYNYTTNISLGLDLTNKT